MTCQLSVWDDTLADHIVNVLELTMIAQVPKSKSKKKKPKNKGGAESTGQSLDIPIVKEVDRSMWGEYDFDMHSACSVIHEGESEYTYYLNIDNVYLHEEMKHSYNPEIIQAQFKYGMVLLGLAITQIHDKQSKDTSETESHDVDEIVRTVSTGFAPFIIPMITTLGGLSGEDVVSLATIGDDQ